jgi:hypothetical protein
MESVMDLLVDKGFLADDNWHVVMSLDFPFGGVEEGAPRAEMKIVTDHE